MGMKPRRRAKDGFPSLAQRARAWREEMGQGKILLEASNLALDEWLQLVREPPDNTLFAKNHFPAAGHRDEFITRIGEWPEEDVRRVLTAFLPCTGTNAVDLLRAEALFADGKLPSLDRPYELRLFRHLILGDPVWEGMHWVLGLLPHRPRSALEALDAFYVASWQLLTDAYLYGLDDARAVIRWRYIVAPHTKNQCVAVLDTLHWRELELLAAALYRTQGYAVQVTARSGDGGVDVIAERMGERLLVQAKHYAEPIGIEAVRALYGVVEAEGALYGVLLTTSTFTRGAKQFVEGIHRVRLVDASRLVEQLNEHVGSDWHRRIDTVLGNERRLLFKATTPAPDAL